MMDHILRSSKVFSLYRAHLREIRKLPHLYVQHFYQVKTRNDARALLSPSAPPYTVSSRFRSGYRILRKLQSANSGDVKAFQEVLTLAYGRSGKFKWELLEPLLTDPTATPPAPIIPKVKDSLPPVYPKPLQALIMNAQSMATRPLKRNAWTKEELIGPRADPYSEDAHLFGPFPKRREYNVQWRFFRTETKKVLPPLEIASSARKEGDETGEARKDMPHYAECLPLQGRGLVSEIETLVGRSAPVPLTRRERMARVAHETATTPTPTSVRHPSRWVRRRYRRLLSEIPILNYTPKYEAKEDEEGSYSVRQSRHALGNAPASDLNVREIDETNLAWLMLGGVGKPAQKAAKNKIGEKGIGNPPC